MRPLTALSASFTLLSSAQAHMSLGYPLPFRAAINPNVPQNLIDYTPTAPLSGTGSNFPCKGYQADLGTAAGKSTATWLAGGQYNFSVLGSATHGGGSCQAALSYDNGTSWKVIHSYQGSCPMANGQDFDFTVPSDAPATGPDGTVFAWLWYNKIGNREIYMSCASVTINPSSSSSTNPPATAYSDRPDLFVANMDNGCTTVEGKEVEFSNPGPDLTNNYTISAADDAGSFTGTCLPVNGIGDGSASDSSGGSSSASPAASGSTGASTVAPEQSSSTAPVASGGSFSASSTIYSSQQATTLATSVYSIPGISVPTGTSESPGISETSSPATFASGSPVETGPPSLSATSVESSVPSVASSAVASTGSSSPSSGLTASSDGECAASGSGTYTCQGSIHGPCCSEWGWCGSTDAYCGTGCQAAYGQCGSFLNTTSSAETSAPTGATFRARRLRY